MPLVVIDIDPEVTYKSRCDRVPSIYGDASNVHVLSSLDMKKVKALVVTYPDPLAVAATVQGALKLNPELRIVARVHRQEDVSRIQKLGAVELVSPEYETSVEVVKRILVGGRVAARRHHGRDRQASSQPGGMRIRRSKRDRRMTVAV